MWDGTIAELAEHMSECVYPVGKMPRWLKEHLLSVKKSKSSLVVVVDTEQAETQDDSKENCKEPEKKEDGSCAVGETIVSQFRSQTMTTEISGKKQKLEASSQIPDAVVKIPSQPIRKKARRSKKSGASNEDPKIKAKMRKTRSIEPIN